MSFCVFGCVGVGVRIATGAARPRNDKFFSGSAVGRVVQEADPYTPFTDRIS